MVAIAILSVLLLAVTALVVTAGHTSYQAELRTQADNLAQSILEQIVDRGFENLEVGTNEVPLDAASHDLDKARATLSVRSLDEYGDRLYEIEVAVEWTYQEKSLRTVRMTRLSSIQTD